MRSPSNTGDDSDREGSSRFQRIFPVLASSAKTAPALPFPRESTVAKIRPLPYAGVEAARTPIFFFHTALPVRLSTACSAPLLRSRNSLPSAMAGENSIRIEPG